MLLSGRVGADWGVEKGVELVSGVVGGGVDMRYEV